MEVWVFCVVCVECVEFTGQCESTGEKESTDFEYCAAPIVLTNDLNDYAGHSTGIVPVMGTNLARGTRFRHLVLETPKSGGDER